MMIIYYNALKWSNSVHAFALLGCVSRARMQSFIPFGGVEYMEKIDYKKQLKDFYKPSAKKVTEVCIHRMNFLMVDGIGSPESNSHKEAIEALYSVAYTLKFMIKKSDRQIDYGVLL